MIGKVFAITFGSLFASMTYAVYAEREIKKSKQRIEEMNRNTKEAMAAVKKMAGIPEES